MTHIEGIGFQHQQHNSWLEAGFPFQSCIPLSGWAILSHFCYWLESLPPSVKIMKCLPYNSADMASLKKNLRVYRISPSVKRNSWPSGQGWQWKLRIDFWLQTSPMTNEPLQHLNMTPNYVIKVRHISSFQRQTRKTFLETLRPLSFRFK